MSVIKVEVLREGKYIEASSDELLLNHDQKVADRLRIENNRSFLIDQIPTVRCGVCKEPVYIRRMPLNASEYCFSHYKTDDPVLKRCIQRTEKNLPSDLIRALKYQGRQESSLHRRMKLLIADLLLADPSIQNNSVKVEKVLKNQGEWRKPDVQAVHSDRLIAFEVQVSTEFVQSIVLREHFYERFGQIIWVMPNFQPDLINQSQKDILTSNNDHLFSLDQEVRRMSFDRGELHLKAWIHWPTINGLSIQRIWLKKYITLKDINFYAGKANVLDVKNEEASISKHLSDVNSIKINNFILKQSIGYWWKRWNSFCLRLTSGKYNESIKDKWLSDSSGTFKADSLPSIWLRLHGFDLSLSSNYWFPLKAMNCASKGTLMYNYSSWKWIAKELARSHLQWLGGFYHTLICNGFQDVWNAIKNDSYLKEKLIERNQKKVGLKHHEKILLNLIDDKVKIGIPPSTYEIEDINSNGVGYYYEKNSSSSGRGATPPEVLNIQYNIKKAVSGVQANNSEYDIVDGLNRIKSQGEFIPFPNLPNSSGRDFFKIPNDSVKQFLDSWDKQLRALEEELSRMAILDVVTKESVETEYFEPYLRSL